MLLGATDDEEEEDEGIEDQYGIEENTDELLTDNDGKLVKTML